MHKIAKLIGLLTALIAPVTTAQADDLEIEHIANAGVRITSGEKTVLIDAIFEVHDVFNYLDDEAFTELSKRGADIAMSTHAHDDHFGRKRIESFIDANPDTLFIGTWNMWDYFWKRKGSAQLALPALDYYEEKTFTHNGIKVTALHFPHMETDHYIENYAYIVEINGWRVLHVGDAGMDKKGVKALRFNERDIDVAIIHDLFSTQEDYFALRDQIGAHKIAFMHMVDEKAAPVGAWIAANDPDAEMLVTGHEGFTVSRGDMPGAR